MYRFQPCQNRDEDHGVPPHQEFQVAALSKSFSSSIHLIGILIVKYNTEDGWIQNISENSQNYTSYMRHLL